MRFDSKSATWLLFEKQLDQEREDLVAQLCAENIEERASDVIRGKLAMIDYIVDDIKPTLSRED